VHLLMKARMVVLLVALTPLTAFVGSTRADVTIYQVQLGAFAVGTVVEIDGVVVTAAGLFDYFVQEPNPNPDPPGGRQYSGIRVFTNGMHTIYKGDVVDLRGTYQEYYGFSEIDATPLGSFTTYVGPGAVPDPIPCLISEVNDAGGHAEAYEGVLVQVDRNDNSLYAYGVDQYNEWYVRTNSDGTGDSLLVDHYPARSGGDFEYETPSPGSLLAFSRGILVYDHNHFKLAPRGDTDLGGAAEVALVTTASALHLAPNWPNPFAGETAIVFSLDRPGRVSLEITDAAGRLVRRLAFESLDAGEHLCYWNGTTGSGTEVGAGTYFCRLKSDGRVLSRKMVILP
jgi:hypothetical protein